MKTPTALLLGAVLALPIALDASRPRPAFALTASPCTMTALKPAVTDDSPGMGREGIDLTLTSLAGEPCALGPVTIAFHDRFARFRASGRLPQSHLVLRPGDAATTQIVWSDGIGGNGPCGDATTVAVFTGVPPQGRVLTVKAHICALHAAKPSFIAQPFSLVKR
jgi:hypothetical protein